MSKMRNCSMPMNTAEETTVVSSFNDQEEKKELERSWSDLPQDLLSLILSHLFAGDASAFNAVCRSWQSITSAIRPLPPPIDSPHCQSPCLMFFQRSDHAFKFFHPIYNDFYHLVIPELLDAEIRCSNYGWLLMSCADLRLFFFNPFTKVKIELPRIPIRCGFLTMCFSSPPTSSDCVVVGISGMCTADIGIIRRGEESWITHEFENTRMFRIADCNPVLYRGMYYCLGVGGNVGIFDPKDNAHSWTVCGKPLKARLRDSLRQSFMVELDGELLATFVSHEDRRICVSRLDLHKMVWQTVQSLGDRMLYVSHSASFAETAVVKGMANKIYFPKLQGNNSVFYSLTTRKCHSFSGNFGSGKSFQLKELKHCTWIKPTFETVHEEELRW